MGSSFEDSIEFCSNGQYCANIIVYDAWESLEVIKAFQSKNPPITLHYRSQIDDVIYFEFLDGKFNQYRYPVTKAIKLTDKSGTIFSAERSILTPTDAVEFFNVLIDCDVNCCSEYELLVESENYPGWVCKPLEPISDSVIRMNGEVSRWGI